MFQILGASHLRCRVVNRPYDIFGTWFSDQHLISGDLHWLAHLVSTSVLWLNKANQEIDSEHVPIMNQLYKFYNRNASSIRGIMVANCPWLEDSDEVNADAQQSSSTVEAVQTNQTADSVKRAGNPLSQPKIAQTSTNCGASCSSGDNIGMQVPRTSSNTRSIQYLAEFREEFEENHCEMGDADDNDDDYTEDSDEDSQAGKV